MALQIAHDIAANGRCRSTKTIAATLSRYLEAADVPASKQQFDHLVAVIASATSR